MISGHNSQEEEFMSRTKNFGNSVAALVIMTAVLLVAPDALAKSKFKTLHMFKSRGDGSGPEAGLVMDPAGNLYGTTTSGGANGFGSVFRLTPNSGGRWTESVLYNFCSLTNCADGETPVAGLIFDTAGNLYGTTTGGGNAGSVCGSDRCGVVFELTPNANGSWTESVLYTFCAVGNCVDGATPYADLIFDAAGNLYGTTSGGGSAKACPSSCGVVFKLIPKSSGSWTESVLYNFCSRTHCVDGIPHVSSLIFDGAGNLYGTTGGGGAKGAGTVFELKPNSDGSWSESVLYSFCSRYFCADGTLPWSSPIFDQKGNLYGTTVGGGRGRIGCIGGCGTIFELTPNRDGSWQEKVLHAFKATDGAAPVAGLIFDVAGRLYGTTVFGTKSSSCNGGSCGVVFKLALNAKGRWNETVLHRFYGHPEGWPSAALVFDPAGNLYSTTTYGGARRTFGSVFEITP
jgi:uncharacterized repeat protein (TIGR03803 family)